MMVFLIENVLSDVFSLRFADAEPAVATLPCEVWDVFFDPFTGVGFEFAHEVGVGDCGAGADEEMDVIWHSVDFESVAAEVFDGGGEVGEEFALDHGGDEGLAVFGAEDEVGEVLVEGAGHGGVGGSVTPAGVSGFFGFIPRVAPAARIWRRCRGWRGCGEAGGGWRGYLVRKESRLRMMLATTVRAARWAGFSIEPDIFLAASSSAW